MLNKEGEYGKAIIGRYTRQLSLVISVVQALGYAFYLESFTAEHIVFAPGLKFKLFFTVCMVAGSMFVLDLVRLLRHHD